MYLFLQSLLSTMRLLYKQYIRFHAVQDVVTVK
jgi:hypothetical protein